MFALVVDGNIKKYPYSIGMLRRDNPNTSFPKSPSDAFLRSWGVERVEIVDRPDVGVDKTAVEGAPVRSGDKWIQSWSMVFASAEEIAARKDRLNAQADQARLNAYASESDPVFFKWQRGEATQEEWLSAIAAIKARFPKIA
jgi:hypothetical protein